MILPLTVREKLHVNSETTFGPQFGSRPGFETGSSEIKSYALTLCYHHFKLLLYTILSVETCLFEDPLLSNLYCTVAYLAVVAQQGVYFSHYTGSSRSSVSASVEAKWLVRLLSLQDWGKRRKPIHVHSEIETRHLRNTSQKRYCLSQLPWRHLRSPLLAVN